jgi:hypothetical protein
MYRGVIKAWGPVDNVVQLLVQGRNPLKSGLEVWEKLKRCLIDSVFAANRFTVYCRQLG